jgi:cation/acetate symporter
VGGAAIGAVLLAVLGPPQEGWPETLTTQPAAWTVPLAFTVMVAVSITTRRRTPADAGAPVLRLHAPRRCGCDGPRRWGQGGQLLRSWKECG